MNAFVLAVAATALALCSEVRLPLGPLNVSFAEIFALIAIVQAPKRFKPGVGAAPFAILAAGVTVCVLAILLSGGAPSTITATRNLLIPAAFLVALLYARLTTDEAVLILKTFVGGAVACAVLAVLQAMIGSPPVFSLYAIPGVVHENLREVMAWKLSTAQLHKLIPGQKSLGFGLNLFSNNFGEFIVYAWAALLTLWSMGRAKTSVVLSISALFGVALAASLARTSMAGAVLVVAIFAFAQARSMLARTALVLGTVGAWLLLVDQARALVGFDRLGSLRGRAGLNQIALDVYGRSDFASLLAGGDAPLYWSYTGAFSAPHNALIYMLIEFGLLGAALGAISVLMLGWALFRRYGQAQDRQARALALGGLMATAWFVIYGSTWAVVVNANSTFQWALFVGVGLASFSAEVVRRRKPSPVDWRQTLSRNMPSPR